MLRGRALPSCSLASFLVCRLDAAEQRFPEVEMLVGQGRLAEAESTMPEQPRQDPTNIEAKLKLIRAYRESKRTGDGLRLAAELPTAQERCQLHTSLGVLLATEGQNKSAQAGIGEGRCLKARDL